MAKAKQKPQITLRDFIEYLDEKMYLPKYNVVTRDIEIPTQAIIDYKINMDGSHSYKNFVTCLTDELQQMYAYVTEDKIEKFLFTSCTSNIVEYVNPTHKPMFNPVLDALENIRNGESTSKIDKNKDYLSEFCEIFQINDELSKTLVNKWLLQALALLYNTNRRDDLNADGVLVFVGAHGLGKSYFSILLTQPFQKYSQKKLTINKAIKPSDRDSVMQCTSAWICEVGEIESTFNKSDISELKDFITSRFDFYRNIFGTKAEQHARTTSFFGTCNNFDYLNDVTGSRRFYTILCDTVDKDALNNFDFLGLWYQIYVELLEKGLQCFRLTDAERTELEARNTLHTAKIKAQQEIEDIITIADNNPERYTYAYITATEFQQMYSYCLAKYSAVQVGKAISVVLNNAGKNNDVKKIKKNGIPINTKYLPVYKDSHYHIVHTAEETTIDIK